MEYGESDLILTLLAREHGVISAIARGARRSRKRFGAGLGFFNVSSATFARSPRRELFELSSVELRRAFASVAADVAAMAHASYGTEVARELLPAETPEPEVFDLVVELYETLSVAGASPFALRAFELRLLSALGLAPVLSRCVGCSRDLPLGAGDGAVLSPSRDGVLCSRCCGEGGEGRKLEPGARALLLAAAELPLEGAAELSGAERELSRQARDAMVSLILRHVGKSLRSLEFIAKLRGGGSGQDATNDSEA